MTKSTSTDKFDVPPKGFGWKQALASGGRPCGDWRDRLARRLAVEKSRKYRFPVDRQVRKLIHVYHHELHGKPLRKSLQDYYSTLRSAREILADRMERLRLEVAIVSGLPATQIAEQLAISLDDVELYEAVYFDVRDRFKGYWAVTTRVLPPVEEDPERNFVLKMAYEAGYDAAMEVIERIPFFGQPHDLETPEGRARELTELLMLSRGIDWYSVESSPATFAARSRIGENDHHTRPTVTELLRPTLIRSLVQVWSAANLAIDSEKEMGKTPRDRRNVA